MKSKSVLLFLFSSIVFGQTQAKSTKPESPEHRHARIKLEQTVTFVVAVEAKGLPMPRKVVQIMSAADNKELFRSLIHENNVAAIVHSCPNSLGCDYAQQVKQLDDAVEKDRVRYELADECARVYRQTIDKKSSDLTIRDAEQVAACRAVDSYPLQVAEH